MVSTFCNTNHQIHQIHNEKASEVIETNLVLTGTVRRLHIFILSMRPLSEWHEIFLLDLRVLLDLLFT